MLSLYTLFPRSLHSTQTVTSAKKTTPTTVTRVELGGRPAVSLECDWGVGIGGGVWSTGLLLAEHLSRHAALYDDVFRGKRLLELGSGTGLVGEVWEETVWVVTRVGLFHQPPTQRCNSHAIWNGLQSCPPMCCT